MVYWKNCTIHISTLLQQGMSEPVFYVVLVYKLKRTVGKPNGSEQFTKIIKHYKNWIDHGYHATVCLSVYKLKHGL